MTWFCRLGFKCCNGRGCSCCSPPSRRLWQSPEKSCKMLTSTKKLHKMLTSAKMRRTKPLAGQRWRRGPWIHSQGGTPWLPPQRSSQQGSRGCPRSWRTPPPPCRCRSPSRRQGRPEPVHSHSFPEFWIFQTAHNVSHMLSNGKFEKDYSTHRDDPQVTIAIAVDHNLVEPALVGHLAVLLDVNHSSDSRHLLSVWRSEAHWLNLFSFYSFTDFLQCLHLYLSLYVRHIFSQVDSILHWKA